MILDDQVEKFYTLLGYDGRKGVDDLRRFFPP